MLDRNELGILVVSIQTERVENINFVEARLRPNIEDGLKLLEVYHPFCVVALDAGLEHRIELCLLVRLWLKVDPLEHFFELILREFCFFVLDRFGRVSLGKHIEHSLEVRRFFFGESALLSSFSETVGLHLY